jgi:hypothetical protein
MAKCVKDMFKLVWKIIMKHFESMNKEKGITM